jgi:hypothetical protein
MTHVSDKSISNQYSPSCRKELCWEYPVHKSKKKQNTRIKTTRLKSHAMSIHKTAYMNEKNNHAVKRRPTQIVMVHRIMLVHELRHYHTAPFTIHAIAKSKERVMQVPKKSLHLDTNSDTPPPAPRWKLAPIWQHCQLHQQTRRVVLTMMKSLLLFGEC